MAKSADKAIRPMNKRWFYALMVVSAIALLGFVFWPTSSTNSHTGVEKSNPQAVALPVGSPSATNAETTQKKDGATLEKVVADMLNKAGIKPVPPAKKFLSEETASGDKGRIRRAFHDVVYSRGWKMSEAIPEIKAYLNDTNSFVRFTAAEALFIVGDRSGYPTLLSLVQSDRPIEGTGQDIRIEAAESLAKFRQYEAAVAVIKLYEQTQDGELLSSLDTLEIQVPEEKSFPFIADHHTIAAYARTGDSWFLPQITAVFQSSSDAKLKNAAAWALASMTGDPSATNYLVQQAQTILSNPSIQGGASYAAGADAIKYLGTIQSPQAKQILEAALDSNDSSIVRVAAVNLIFNQGGSAKANQLVVQSLLDGKKDKLGVELALNIAAQIDDPQIKAAGEKVAQQEGTGLWQLYTVERKNWPIYNWIDNYVVKLNR